MSPLVAAAPTNRVILGLMTFGTDTEAGARITDVAEYGKILDLFQSRGYIYIDGKQEAFTREVGWKERGLTLATKVKYPNAPGENTGDKVIASVETSLKELGSDSVDDRATPFANTLEALDKLHKAGKFVRLGLSNFTAFEVAEIVLTCKYNGWVRPSIYQGMYNCITRSIEAELIPACRRYGLDVVIYNPIAGGIFSGKIKSKDMTPAEGRFSDTAKSGKMYRGRYFRDSTFKALQVIETAVEKEGLSMIETALRWAVHHSALKVKDGNDGIIIGVSSIEQLDDNLNHLEKGPLPESVVKALDEAWQISKTDTVNYWHLNLEYQYDTRDALFGAGAK
ncbi:putative aflatoxin b1 aldehyde reductase member 2 protein [Phaeoacremonium minimum UCRPA7]|uniref:Putative aflatoxin b1 aldehyde reductase member 2 protein n=1 Tax=Phaeoacremonium minimum (strain UCR-PA7) TaxID=1286976 RepID=R8BXY9_PHAM7|nr:putative aflatoxin b1 aldehyde reductase member 2 protein [Phaeoacremonium minimum UCRPA7]EOO04195.1 putative aflatoxin b1 aldehyde reductase member 2 protein [Phaeoacremonium minimum UCRPA7]